MIYNVFSVLIFEMPEQWEWPSVLFLNTVSRMEMLGSPITLFQNSRLVWWEKLFEAFMQNPFFGCGLGCTHAFENSSFSITLAGDMGYLKRLAELGLAGSLVFISLVGKIGFLVYSAESTFSVRKWLVAYFVAVIFCEASYEFFQLSKGAGFYWMIMGGLLGFRFNKTLDLNDFQYCDRFRI